MNPKLDLQHRINISNLSKYEEIEYLPNDTNDSLKIPTTYTPSSKTKPDAINPSSNSVSLLYWSPWSHWSYPVQLLVNFVQRSSRDVMRASLLPQ
jgi:hypothetical protein